MKTLVLAWQFWALLAAGADGDLRQGGRRGRRVGLRDLLLGERLSATNWAGVLLIAAGASLVATR